MPPARSCCGLAQRGKGTRGDPWRAGRLPHLLLDLTLAIVISLMFFAGRLLAKYGSRVMLIVGGIIMTAGLALFAASTGNLTFYIAGALLGLGYGMSIALVPPASSTPGLSPDAASCSASVLAGTGVGGLIWASIGPRLAQSSLGWRGVVWIMAAAMALCTIVPALFLIRNKPADVGLVPYGADTAQAAASAAPRVRPARRVHLQAGPEERELLDRVRVVLDPRGGRVRHAGALDRLPHCGIPQPDRQDLLDTRAGRVLLLAFHGVAQLPRHLEAGPRPAQRQDRPGGHDAHQHDR